MTKLSTSEHRSIIISERLFFQADYMYVRRSMGKCVFGAYTDSEGPDHPVHCAV